MCVTIIFDPEFSEVEVWDRDRLESQYEGLYLGREVNQTGGGPESLWREVKTGVLDG